MRERAPCRARWAVGSWREVRWSVRVASLAVLVGVAAAEVLAGAPRPKLEALQARLKKGGQPDAQLVQLGREAIAEARESHDDEAWRDALLISAQSAMVAEGFDAGMKVLEASPWPASPAATAVLHLLAADALIQQTRRPEARQGVPTFRDFAWEIDALRWQRLFFDRLADAERHLGAAKSAAREPSGGLW